MKVILLELKNYILGLLAGDLIAVIVAKKIILYVFENEYRD